MRRLCRKQLLAFGRKRRLRERSRLMDHRGQRDLLRRQIQSLEYLISEALASAEVLRGAADCGVQLVPSDCGLVRLDAVVALRLVHSVADNLLLRTAVCFERGPARRSIQPLEVLDRLRYRDRGAHLRSFWAKVSQDHAGLLKNLKVFRDKFLAHYEPGGIRDATLNPLDLAPLLEEYFRALKALRREVFSEDPEHAPVLGVREAAGRVFGLLRPPLQGSEWPGM